MQSLTFFPILLYYCHFVYISQLTSNRITDDTFFILFIFEIINNKKNNSNELVDNCLSTNMSKGIKKKRLTNKKLSVNSKLVKMQTKVVDNIKNIGYACHQHVHLVYWRNRFTAKQMGYI